MEGKTSVIMLSKRKRVDMNRTGSILMSILAGVLAGIIMSFFLLLFFISTGFSVSHPMFFLELAAACSLPLCLGFLKRQSLSPFIAGLCMIAVSFVITLLYGIIVGNASAASYANENITGKITGLSAMIHACALISCTAVNLIRIK